MILLASIGNVGVGTIKGSFQASLRRVPSWAPFKGSSRV